MIASLVTILLVVAGIGADAAAYNPPVNGQSEAAKCKSKVRFGTINSSLNRDNGGQMLNDLESGKDVQAKNISHILQLVRPDVVALQEFDYVPNNAAINAYQKNYLSKPAAKDVKGISYPYVYAVPSNTGILSGRDLDKNGSVALPGDGFGFGRHAGQYAFAVLSKYPLDTAAIRTFQNFLWKDMPNRLIPIDPKTNKPKWDAEDMKIYRLSSKNHVDVPVKTPHGVVHFLVSHPTPPVFGLGNAERNYDEIRLLADYVGCGKSDAKYLYDDKGKRGGIAPSAKFVIAGDQNADPKDGDSYKGAINQLVDCKKINTKVTPKSEGGKEFGQMKKEYTTDPATKTSEFGLRVDYVLPSASLPIANSGVFWPTKSDPLVGLNEASDHHPVWVDVCV